MCDGESVPWYGVCTWQIMGNLLTKFPVNPYMNYFYSTNMASIYVFMYMINTYTHVTLTIMYKQP